MVLYKLPFAVFPIQDIYARSREDIEEWLDRYHRNPIPLVVTKSEKQLGRLSDIVVVEKGELAFDLVLPLASPQHAYIDFLPDFTAKINLSSIPVFPFFLQRIEEYKHGNLYEVLVSPNGSFISASYVPDDVFHALRKIDISGFELKAEKHICCLNKTLRNEGIGIIPKVTKQINFN